MAAVKSVGGAGTTVDNAFGRLQKVLDTPGGQKAFGAALRASRAASVQRGKGEDGWAFQGYEKVLKADKTGAMQKNADKILGSKKGRRMLIEISNLKPGSARFKRLMEKIREEGK